MIKRLYETHNVRVLYFSFYFSDYNLIEKFFSMFKKWLKQYYETYNNKKFFEKSFCMSIKVCSNEKFVKQHFYHVGIHVT